MELPKIYVALDYQSASDADALIEQLPSGKVGLKVGKELFTSAGPQWVASLVEKGFSIFLDLKFHDIPNTVAKAVTAAAKLGVDVVNVHASGGSRMMKAAADALKETDNPPLLIGVTVLTSMDESDLKELGISKSVNEQVEYLARLAKSSGLKGVVCSAQEANMLKAACGNDFKLMTPGIRPEGSSKDDQRRTMTPAEAVTVGVDYMVIGRPITQSPNPAQAVENILASIA
ncbi:orotidine 5'-phosphate decarboxylase [Idiomarina sp. WRN-38]|jgi:orotidine-5'-phosphate decarboxylase|uniref:orotidine-5'-phosphate decarboxylase n=1 Tax=Idiomarina sp. OXR-189 TaxID=3100175 RepID=UPI0007337D06|nr:orotidine-5'-phosphate decarboxylase [Idiomarina sp. OXR-189]KTG23670.1 orotidine 5'-phosphate decarboxylase [Idiomarina sp. H105]OAE91062.1 orotidine 5'-phosphate decarboxylase [Idiomarina sp. WRN-38]WPZ00257.1 orotidine-5'-phosphate decarboxylase [Idiomarina sp. OXR-189]